MKHPTPSDFIVKVEESHVSVIFKPSNSDYYFGRLVDPEDIARFGPLSSPNVRHGDTGDTGDYPSEEVAQMAHSLAVKADKPIIARENLHLAVRGTYWHGSACLAKTRTPPSLPLRT